MPFGLQMIGPLRGDAKLLSMAKALEKAWAADAATARPRPDMGQLATVRPELKSIVTHPPIFEGAAPGADANVAV